MRSRQEDVDHVGVLDDQLDHVLTYEHLKLVAPGGRHEVLAVHGCDQDPPAVLPMGRGLVECLQDGVHELRLGRLELQHHVFGLQGAPHVVGNGLQRHAAA
jgi:hypothetical protein